MFNSKWDMFNIHSFPKLGEHLEEECSCFVEAKMSEHIAQECGPGASPDMGPLMNVSFHMHEILQCFYFQKMSTDLQEMTSTT